MHLWFVQRFNSIDAFEEADLPSFTLVTGPNGIGKTLFLISIANQSIQNDLTKSAEEIKYLKASAFSIHDASTLDLGEIERERKNAINLIAKAQENAVKTQFSLRNTLLSLGIEITQHLDVPSAIENGLHAIEKLENDARHQATIALQQAISQANNSINNYLQQQVQMHNMQSENQHAKRVIDEVASKLEKSTIFLRESDISTYLGKVDSDFLSHSFTKMFLEYHWRWIDNKTQKFLKSEGVLGVSAFDDDEFVARYGQAPWDQVNDILQTFNPDLSISHPQGVRGVVFQANLTKKSTGAVFPFSSLSSGEQVFFTLFVAVTSDILSSQRRKVPKLLLLDEVETSLHPSMVKSFLTMVNDVFIVRFGMNVIMTTHSPTTVALSEEQAVYIMDSSPRRLRRATKSQAIAELTIGVPYLALTFDGRRQVFVESPKDAKVYDRLFSILRIRLKTERSLEFIGAGSGDRDSGCSQVIRVVNGLAEAGNQSVFGLIDWDCANKAQGRVRVLASGRRNGLENVILDPFVIACFIVRDARKHLDLLNLGDAANLRQITSSPYADAQRLLSCVEGLVLPPSDTAIRCESVYSGGFRLQARTEYMQMDDHDLEKKLRARLPNCNAFANNGAGELMYAVTDRVLNEYPELIPSEIIDAFEELLTISP